MPTMGSALKYHLPTQDLHLCPWEDILTHCSVELPSGQVTGDVLVNASFSVGAG